MAAIFRGAGLEIRGLEGAGDHLVVCGARGQLRLHSETKRQETARPWAWWEQAEAETPAGATTAVSFRRNRSPWLSMLLTAELARLAALAAIGLRVQALVEAGNELAGYVAVGAAAESGELGAELLAQLERWDAIACELDPASRGERG